MMWWGEKEECIIKYSIKHRLGSSRQPQAARGGTVSGRKQQKARKVCPSMGRAGCPSRGIGPRRVAEVIADIAQICSGWGRELNPA